MNLKVTGLFSDSRPGNGIPLVCLTFKGADQGRVLVEQSQIAASWQVFVHVTQETPQKWSLDFGFGAFLECFLY